MRSIIQGQWFTGHYRMETVQVHCQTTEEVYTRGKPSQTQVIQYSYKVQKWLSCS
jgi:hypothetical protein